jgi:hypothetical protein
MKFKVPYMIKIFSPMSSLFYCLVKKKFPTFLLYVLMLGLTLFFTVLLVLTFLKKCLYKRTRAKE